MDDQVHQTAGHRRLSSWWAHKTDLVTDMLSTYKRVGTQPFGSERVYDVPTRYPRAVLTVSKSRSDFSSKSQRIVQASSKSSRGERGMKVDGSP